MPQGPALFYLTAGGAFAQVKDTVSFSYVNVVQSGSHDVSGYAVERRDREQAGRVRPAWTELDGAAE